MNLGARRVEDPELNVISMIDVLLMLLIFFMLSTTFIHPSRIRVVLPRASHSSTATPTQVTITVTRRGRYFVDNQELINSRASTLRKALEKIHNLAKAEPISLRADARAPTQSIVTAMNVAGQLGFSHINILTVKSGKK